MPGGIRVLHVDSEHELVERAAAALEREDGRFAVETATSLADGVARFREGVFDCVVSEYDLPDGTGIEFLETVRERHPDLPFVLFTGTGSESVASEAISAGVTDYLPKRDGPEQYATLASRIADAVERHRTEREGERTEQTERLETLVSNLPGITYRCRNSRPWPMEFVRGECESLTGYTPDAIQRGDVTWGEDIIHPGDQTAVWDSVQAALDTGDAFELTYRIRTADGDTKWVWERGRAVAVPDREATVLEGFITDVTDRTEHEQRLETLTRRLEALHRAAGDLLAAGTCREVAEVGVEVAADVLGLDANAIHRYDDERAALVPIAATDTVRELVGEPPTFTAADSIAWRTFQRGESVALDDVSTDADVYNPETPIRSELQVPIADHGILIAGSPDQAAFDDQDQLLGELLADSIATAFDQIEQTEQLRARERELTRQNERLEEFASVVSHDLRNPLNVAQGRLELLREECDSEHIDPVSRAHDRMGALIEDLLTLARQGGSLDELDEVDLGTLVRACWQNVETDRATLVVDTDATIRADGSRLKQLFENLARNSVEHGSTGSQRGPRADDSVEHGSTGSRPKADDSAEHTDGSVTVTVGDLDDGFYVEDDGPGIPPDDRERVFEAGYSTRHEGTGFGLSIVRDVVEAHDWTVRVTDGSAGGARFEITGVERVDG